MSICLSICKHGVKLLFGIDRGCGAWNGVGNDEGRRCTLFVSR